MNCPSCNYKTGILGVMVSKDTVAKDMQKEGDIYVCPMCETVSFIHGDRLLLPRGELEQNYVESNKDMIERVQQLYRNHRKDKVN